MGHTWSVGWTFPTPGLDGHSGCKGWERSRGAGRAREGDGENCAPTKKLGETLFAGAETVEQKDDDKAGNQASKPRGPMPSSSRGSYSLPEVQEQYHLIPPVQQAPLTFLWPPSYHKSAHLNQVALGRTEVGLCPPICAKPPAVMHRPTAGSAQQETDSSTPMSTFLTQCVSLHQGLGYTDETATKTQLTLGSQGEAHLP